jgi:hypothetical protein
MKGAMAVPGVRLESSEKPGNMPDCGCVAGEPGVIVR